MDKNSREEREDGWFWKHDSMQSVLISLKIPAQRRQVVVCNEESNTPDSPVLNQRRPTSLGNDLRCSLHPIPRKPSPSSSPIQHIYTATLFRVCFFFVYLIQKCYQRTSGQVKILDREAGTLCHSQSSPPLPRSVHAADNVCGG